ncbi:MAG: Holliday junction branch migration protein RuvA [Candidatus Eisenbacteria bacterium]
MIASLRGRLAELGAGQCVIEAGGVGYLVSVSTFTAGALPAVGAEAFLRVRQVVREDALLLFGFSGAEEQRLFDLLVSVSGVGPKLALAVLSGLRPEALARAIHDESVASLVAIPGIGRRTAERLVVELRDRIGSLPAASPSREGGGVLPRTERMRDAVAALTRLGYTTGQAEEALRHAVADRDDASLEDLVRGALSRLSRAAATVR